MKEDLIQAKKNLIAFYKDLQNDVEINAQKYFSDNLALTAFHPVNECEGYENVHKNLFLPLKRAFRGLERRDSIVMAGEFTTGSWIATQGVYFGTFIEDFLGIPANNHLSMISYGEFYRIEDGKIAEMRIIYDVIDLMRQAGVCPLPKSAGIEGLYVPPYSYDGVMMRKQSSATTQKSLMLVEDMIFKGLRKFDPKEQSLQAMGMERYWSKNMMWYGPGGIGANRGVDGFQIYHQRPFLAGFPDRVGGNHRSRFAEGLYVASTGWPSIHATHRGEYLGQPATNLPITMRVMDFWRREKNSLTENWVYIDIPHLFLQIGRNLFAEMNQLRKNI